MLNLRIGGVLVQVAVETTDTATTLAAAINANGDLPVTAAPALGGGTVTARNKGTLGNDIDLRMNYYPLSERTPAGVTVTIVAMASGAADPSIATAIANLGETQYNTILMGLNDAITLGLIETELDGRWGPLKQIDGWVHTAVRGTVGTLNTWGSSRNSPHVIAWAVEAGGSPSPTWQRSEARSARTTSAASIRPGQCRRWTAPACCRPRRKNALSGPNATICSATGWRRTLQKLAAT